MFKMMMALFGLLSASMLANDGGSGGTGEGAGDGDGATGGQANGDGSTGGDGGTGSTLEADAQAAIEQLKAAGQEIPEALSKAVKELSDARKEAAGYRTGRNELRTEFDNLKTGLAKALGLDSDDGEVDPQKLQAQIAERDQTLKTQQVELAAYRAAGKHGANPDALLDSRSFLTAAAGLDPSADDFATKLDDTIKQALEANANLKATPGGGRNGGPAQGPRTQDPSAAVEPGMSRLRHAYSQT